MSHHIDGRTRHVVEIPASREGHYREVYCAGHDCAVGKLRAWEIPSTASSRNHLSLRLLLKLVRSGDPANNPKLVENVLQGALNHPGTVIVQDVVDPARIILTVRQEIAQSPNESYLMNDPLRSMYIARACALVIHGLDLSDNPASHGWIPPTISRCRLNDACKLFMRVLGGEIDEDHVIPLSNGLRVHFVGKALGN